MDVENTQPSGTINRTTSCLPTGLNTQILVNDGGTIVIGGVIQTSNSVSISQTPILGSIPLLGNLFKERLVKTETDELIFFITPKIIHRANACSPPPRSEYACRRASSEARFAFFHLQANPFTIAR